MHVREFLHPVTLLGERNTLADANASLSNNTPVFVHLGGAWHALAPHKLVGYPLTRRLIDVPLDGVTPVSPDEELQSILGRNGPSMVIPVEEHGQIVGHLDRRELLDALALNAGTEDLTDGLLPRVLGPLLHDLSNSLIVAEAALDPGTEGEPCDRLAAQGALRHIAALVTRVRETCAGDREAPPCALDVNAALRALMPLVKVLAGPDIAIELRLAETVGLAFAYRRLVERTVLNLILNAQEALRSGGLVRMSTREALRGETRWTVLTVEDDGPGLPEDAPELVLRRGYTSKSGAARGTGLAGVARALARVGGQITASHSSLGGARFDIFLRQGDAAGVATDGAAPRQ